VAAGAEGSAEGIGAGDSRVVTREPRKGSAIAFPALIFTWFTLVMFIATTTSLFASVFFNQPLPLQKWLIGEELP
jgi:hypothetical protein